MGKLRYDSSLPSILIEDVELAHLKVVIGTKLRRQESFMMTWHPPGGDPGAVCSAWIHPAIPLQFAFDSESIPQVTPGHVAELMERLNATGDLVLAQAVR
ncbi:MULTISPECIES: hypothetical protein [unclassified Microbacterium]|uniref:DUF7882 family protein n=1 Tax=unclassified Microbacterium TaxID=2609290 RepID=UPI000EA94A3B|nr:MULTISPECIES: hypothetical protein [unclassified Microbacterium]MBT2483178.1 hypothetical protein [Microbacterium sp. ISL-108]RKN66232.1 hypothetical protein D7252_00515 [Microbacterium sp. CGR2]